MNYKEYFKQQLLEDLVNEGSRSPHRLLRKAKGIAKKQKRVVDTFSPSDGTGHMIGDVLSARATETLGQIEAARSNRLGRSTEAMARSIIGDKSARVEDAKIKARSGKTIGQHTREHDDMLKTASNILSGKYTKDGAPIEDDQSKSATGFVHNQPPSSDEMQAIRNRSSGGRGGFVANMDMTGEKKKSRSSRNMRDFGKPSLF